MGFLTDLLQGIPLNAVLKEKITAFEDENAALKTENAILKDDKRQLEAENKRLKDEIQRLTHKDDLHETEVKILVALEKAAYPAVAEAVAEHLQLNQTIVEYYLLELLNKEYVQVNYEYDFPNSYSLIQKGRRYLIENDLI